MILIDPTDGTKFFTGRRCTDGHLEINGFDRALRDVGRLHDGQDTWVRLQHDITGHQYARHSQTNKLVRVFKQGATA
jgi:hypothetical protein